MESPGTRSSILVFDSNCGACTNFSRLVRFLDPRRRIVSISLPTADRSGLLDSVEPEQRYRSFHLLIPGLTKSGADALPTLLRLLAGGRFASTFLSAFPFGLNILTRTYTIFSMAHDAGCATTIRQSGRSPMASYGFRSKPN